MKRILQITGAGAGIVIAAILAFALFHYIHVSSYFTGVTGQELARENASSAMLKTELAFKNAVMSSFYREFVEGMSLRGNERVMDFGSGSGTEAYYLAERLSAGGTLVCLDISRTWLKLARNRLKRFSNVEYLDGDIREMKIRRGSFDKVAMHYVLHDIPVPARKGILRAIAASMKVGGALYIREPVHLKYHEGEHGMALDEIRSLMSDAGLRVKEERGGSTFIGGDYSIGIYIKE
jgi:tRNA A58 N-methylase Trm61